MLIQNSVLFFFFFLIQKEGPDLHRYHVSSGSSKVLYMAVCSVLLESGVGGSFSLNVSRLTAASVHCDWVWPGFRPSICCGPEGRDQGIWCRPGTRGGLMGRWLPLGRACVGCGPFWLHVVVNFSRRNFWMLCVFAHRQWFSVYSAIALELLPLSLLTIT